MCDSRRSLDRTEKLLAISRFDPTALMLAPINTFGMIDDIMK